MMKIKLQLNGEPISLAPSNYDNEMHDSEYEIEMIIDRKNLDELESLLSRMISDTGDTFFSYNIINYGTQEEI